MRVVTFQLEVLETEVPQAAHRRFEPQLRQRPGCARELLVGLRQVVAVEVNVTQGKNEIPGQQIAHLRHHPQQQRVRRDVEGQAEENVGAPLVDLERQPAGGDVELEKQVAGRQRHLRHRCDVPGAHDQPPRVGFLADLLQHLAELVDAAAFRRRPGAPLHPVNRTELAVLIRPFIPDADPGFPQAAHVRLAAQEPQQLVGHRFPVDSFGGEQRETGLEVETHLVTEKTPGAHTRAVLLEDAGIAHLAQQLEISLHRGES